MFGSLQGTLAQFKQIPETLEHWCGGEGDSPALPVLPVLPDQTAQPGGDNGDREGSNRIRNQKVMTIKRLCLFVFDPEINRH